MKETLHVGAFSTCMRQPDKHAMIDEFALTPYQIMLGILSAAPQGMTTSEVAEATRETSYNVAGRLKKMWRQGLIEKIIKGGKARWYLPKGS